MVMWLLIAVLRVSESAVVLLGCLNVTHTCSNLLFAHHCALR
jgi:hypothetical protein